MQVRLKMRTLFAFWGGWISASMANGQVGASNLRWVHVSTHLSDSVYLRDVDCPSAKVCYAVGNHHERTPILYKSVDSGDFWWSVPFNHSSLPNQVEFLSEDTGYISGSDGFFARTVNGGQDWDSLPTGGRNFRRFTILNKRRIVGVFGDSVGISPDAGRTWRFQSIGLRVNIISMSFPDSLNGYGVGWWGVWKTADGGETWSPIDTTQFRYLNAVDFPSKDTGFMVSDDEHVYKTTDGGRNWEGFRPYVGRQLNAVTFLNSKIGYIAGNGILYGTEDGGSTWFPGQSDGGGQMRDIFLTGKESGVIVGFFAPILRLVGVQQGGNNRRQRFVGAHQLAWVPYRRDILGRHIR